MSALEAASAGVKDMADGSLRITIEFDPRFAKEAFALFGARGTPLAIAALQVGYASKSDTPPPNMAPNTGDVPPNIGKPKMGPLCTWVVQRCNEVEFLSWIAPVYRAFIGDVDRSDFASGADFCRHAVMVLCECDESRKEIDTDAHKAALFHERIRGPFSKHLAARGAI